MSAPPFVTAGLPGIGGRIKALAEHFVVEELPLYEPTGAGEHVYVRHRRSGRTTREIVVALAREFRLEPRDVGYAGQKDKRAIATQTFSMALARIEVAEVEARIEAQIGGEVLDVRRHANKLRRGHLLGNHFTITVTETVAEAQARARAIAAELDRRGLANFFGPQRYGADGKNAERGRALLEKPKRGWLATLCLSAWQSTLFDRWLALRMERGALERVEAGDVAKRLDNGALFDVVDEAAENERVRRREITFTGPLFGASMRAAQGAPGEIEAEILRAEGVGQRELERARLEGTRRAARIFVAELFIEPVDGGLRFVFRLPKGAYATTVLREFTKDVTTLGADDDES